MSASNQKRFLIVALLLFIPGIAFWIIGFWAKEVYIPKVKDPFPAYETSSYADLLKETVEGGLVDYQKLQNHHAHKLDRYLDAVARFGPKTNPQQFTKREEKLAYYLNIYNALMLRQILRKRIPKKVPRRGFISTKWRVDKSWISLDALEQKVIRPLFKEPRIHFALVGGALGSPPLRMEPYSSENLDEQLEEQAYAFIKSEMAVRVQEGHVLLSSIFKWYRKDFDASGGLKKMLLKYLPENDKRRTIIEQTEESAFLFTEYNWLVNKAESSKKS